MFSGGGKKSVCNICAEDVREPGELCGVVLCDAGADDADAGRVLHPAEHTAHLVSELRAQTATEP